MSRFFTPGYAEQNFNTRNAINLHERPEKCGRGKAKLKADYDTKVRLLTVYEK